MPGSSCIAFLCDEGYLFPTLVAARQARAHTPAQCDIIIFLEADALDDTRRALFETVSGAQIRLIPDWLPKMLDEQVPEGFFQTHVSRAALFRLFVGMLAGDHYERIIYLDGDVQVRRSLADLLTIPIPDGKVAAAPDWLALHSVDGMPYLEQTRAYLTGLQLSPAQWGSYFNSGMMMAAPATWNEVGPAALKFLVSSPEACRLHDQSALNHACRDRISSVSIRWNFLRQYMALPAYKTLDPAIVHFVGKLKPWDGAYAPWGANEFRPYTEMFRALQGSGVRWKRKPLLQRLAYHLKPFVTKGEYADRAYRDRIDAILCAQGTGGGPSA